MRLVLALVLSAFCLATAAGCAQPHGEVHSESNDEEDTRGY